MARRSRHRWRKILGHQWFGGGLTVFPARSCPAGNFENQFRSILDLLELLVADFGTKWPQTGLHKTSGFLNFR
jgi:hypothetical protein